MKNFMKLSLIISMLILSIIHASAEDIKPIYVHGVENVVIDNAITIENSTMVPIRTLAEALGLEVMWLPKTKSVVLWNDETEVRATIDETDIQVNLEKEILSQPPVMIGDSVYLPLRGIAEIIKASVEWNSETGTIDVYMNKDNVKNDKVNLNVLQSGISTYNKNSDKTFYYQSQSEWNFENNGRGYCWVCSYAMAITRTTGNIVTPSDVAEVNSRSGNGAYMQHSAIAEEFNIAFVPALDEDSEYFEKYDAWRGATYINAEDEVATKEALKEALNKYPQGVMVRYTIYPHTMLAVGYDENDIYFYEPAYEYGEYVTFDKTCLKKYKLSDLDYIQAIASK